MKQIITILLLSFLLSGNVLADENPVMMAEKKSYHVGDIIRLKVELKGKGYRLGEIDKEKIAPFEINKKEQVYDEESDSTGFILTGSIFKPGDYIIPPFVIIDEAGNKIKSEQGVITIEPLLKSENDKLKDMKPQVKVSEGGPLWPWIVLILIAIVLVALIYYLKKKKKEQPEAEELVPDVPPHLEALKALERIEGMNLIRDGKIKELYDCVSDVIRNFYGRINGVEAMEMTTGELINALKQKKGQGVAALEEFLKRCDRVKFAKFTPSQMDIEGLTERAKEMITKGAAAEDSNKEISTMGDAATVSMDEVK